MIITTISTVLLLIIHRCLCVSLSMQQWAPPPGTTKGKDQWTQKPTWHAESVGAFVGLQGDGLNFPGVLDVAHAYYNWLIQQTGAVTPNGYCLVAAMWDPSTKKVWASSIPQGPRKVLMAKQSNKAPVWLAQANPLLATYLAAQDPPGANADLSKVALHAEDAVYFNWETTTGSASRIQNGHYPDGSMIAVWGKGPRDPQEGRQWALCSNPDKRNPTCRAVASALGVQYQSSQPAAPQPQPDTSDEAYDNDITQSDDDAFVAACEAMGAKKRHVIRGQGPVRRDATTTATTSQCTAIPMPSADSASSISLDLPSSDFGTANAAPTVACTYNDATPEGPASCVCSSGTSTISVKPTSIASPTEITQSCDFSTWPGNQPTATAPAETVTTNFPGCQVCTVLGPNEDDCSPLPSSLGCVPAKTSTVLSADTSGVSVGTLTGTALFSAITSGIDSLCQVPKNSGAAVGSYTCTETATATLATNIKYEDLGPFGHGEPQFDDSGTLTMQVTEANYDSLEWYATNKPIIAAFAQNSTQGNCKSVNAIEQANGATERTTFSLCQAGSNFQLIEVDPASSSGSSSRELSFSLQFHLDSTDEFFCAWLENAVEFIETAVAVETDTEAAVPEELAIDQKLLEACQGSSS